MGGESKRVEGEGGMNLMGERERKREREGGWEIGLGAKWEVCESL